MALIDCSGREFTEKLASAAAVPGGGGAAALAGALAAALGGMVCALTAGKKKYAAVESDIRRLAEQAESLRRELLGCVDADAAAFAPLAAAYAIPKDAPGRAETMERCLRDAAAVPLRIAECCAAVIEMQRELLDKGSALAVSDAASGAALARGALCAAAANVRVNTRLMRDRDCAAALDARADALLAEFCPLADRIFEDYYKENPNG